MHGLAAEHASASRRANRGAARHSSGDPRTAPDVPSALTQRAAIYLDRVDRTNAVAH